MAFIFGSHYAYSSIKIEFKLHTHKIPKKNPKKKKKKSIVLLAFSASATLLSALSALVTIFSAKKQSTSF